MKNSFFNNIAFLSFFFVLFSLFPRMAHAFCEDGSESVITQYGITWTFGQEYQCGQFVNGDYWVIDEGSGVTITAISPGYAYTPRAMNGSMINPSTALQGYDSFMSSDQGKNAGINISLGIPLVLMGDKSLVSTISNSNPGDHGGGNHVSYIKTAAVLTSMLTRPPPEGSFRPGISSATKTLHNVSSIHLELLRRLAIPPGQNISTSTLETYANYFEMVWLDHNGGWTTRYVHPTDSGLNNYYFPITFSEAALLLHLDFSNTEKERLLINYLQIGIDLYSFIESGAIGWPSDGGHSNGGKWPVLFAGLMLDYAPMKNIGQKSGAYMFSGNYKAGNLPPDYIHFGGEDGQTFYVTQDDVNITSSSWISDSMRVGII